MSALAPFAAAVLALATPALADPWLLAPGEHYSQVGASTFTADGYYNLDGDRQPLSGGGLHSEHAAYSYNEFGWTKNRTFILAFPFQSVTRTPGGTGSLSHTTETGFGDLNVGVRFKIHRGKSPLSLQVGWNPPMGYSRTISPRLGEGASNAVANLEWGTAIGHAGFIEIGGGYRYYLDKVSVQVPDAVTTAGSLVTVKLKSKSIALHAPTDQMLASATAGFWIGHSLLLGGHYEGSFARRSWYRGVATLIDLNGPLPKLTQLSPFDPLPGEAAPGSSSDEVSVHLAGPQLLYRLDDRLDLIAGSMHTMSAKNALHVDRFYVAVAVKQTKLNRLQGLLGSTSKP